MSSHASTPHLSPSHPPSLPPSAAPFSLPSSVPELTTSILTTSEEKVAALKLIADSIAQQRQTASKALILSPAFLAVWVLAMAVLYQLLYNELSDVGILFTTGGGVTMALFLACRMVTGGYISAAEALSWGFLQDEETAEEDVVIGATFGEEVIGALVLRVENAKAGGKRGGKRAKAQACNAIIRAWTVRLRYRNKGVGRGLLEEAVRLARERGGRDVKVGFARDHANSTMLLWEMFNGVFRRQQKRAVEVLDEVDREFGAERWRR
jgi:hypothetical protein